MERSMRPFPLRTAAVCGAVGITSAAALCMLFALLIAHSWLPQGREALLGRCALFASGAVSALLASRRREVGKLPAALGAGVLPLLAALAISLFADVSTDGNMSIFYNALCVICGVLAGCALTIRRRRRGKRKARRR